MTNPQPSGSGLTVLGKLISLVLILGLVGLGAWIMLKPKPPAAGGGGAGGAGGARGGPAKVAAFDTKDLEETQTSIPKLDPPGAYVPQNNVLDIELSNYAGYAGLIAANGGLDPSDNSIFAQKHGFKVRIKISEDESWSALNAGKMAASATTADVLAVYGRQFQVIVPAQIGYSRGADGIVVRDDIRKLNDLKGKTVASCQFTESDFLLRYLANEANIPVKMQADLKSGADPDAINVVFTKDGLAAGDLFAKALAANSPLLAGCVTWAPKTTDLPAESNGKARLLVSNRNLLLVADILVVNKGFADKNPKMVAGLVDGLLRGNQAVRDNPEANADVVAKAFKWTHAKALEEFQKVHLSNVPEQLAFFTGSITQGGSYANIFESAVQTYAADFKDLTQNPVNAARFLALDALKQADASGDFKDQVAAITPLAARQAVAENDPVLSKDIRFLFTENKWDLDLNNADNVKNLAAIKRILDVAPGSRIQLVGHVDPLGIPRIRQSGGEPAVRAAALQAKELSQNRADEIKKQLIAREKVDEKRLQTVGQGWDKPVSQTNGELNRRVEVQWFTLE